ncbi:MAG: AAA family ATPase [Tissierella sp.]|nr:AAA family ATPase [Tissierella sp.]
MKNVFFINGTMGVGKTATSRELQKLLPKCAFLDGDWCWDMNPFIVTDETKNMVEDNICYVLNNFLRCSEYENIIYCWVMHEEYIIKNILSKLNLQDIILYKISLICSEQSLVERISKDVERGIRTKDVIERSIARLSNYVLMDTIKIDVSNIDSNQAAQQIINNIGG